jgi:hypothetical protein
MRTLLRSGDRVYGKRSPPPTDRPLKPVHFGVKAQNGRQIMKASLRWIICTGNAALQYR